MENRFIEKFRKAFNVFMNREDIVSQGPSYYYRPDRVRLRPGTERSIITSIFNRIAMDVSSIVIRHVKIDENGRYLEEIKSGLNECLKTEANIDQTGSAFIHDMVLSMLDEGVVAAVPVEVNPGTDYNFLTADTIKTIRVGKIIQWYPKKVKVHLYNDDSGIYEDVIVDKRTTSIIESPLYSVINEPNSTMQRLAKKLALLDMIDEQNSSGKLDIIIQLPYALKGELRLNQAEVRRKQIEDQLVNSKYGIAYTDGTEKITQLNRPVENNLMKQVEFLTSMLYSQLGLTNEIMNGTADDKTMLNYNNRIVEPILNAIILEFNRKFLTKTARTQKQAFMYFAKPFRFSTIDQIASAADTFTRNEIMSSNEIRQILGLKPSSDPAADELRNKNLNQAVEPIKEVDKVE